MHLLVLLNKQLAFDLILGFVTGGGELRRYSKDYRDRVSVVALYGLEKALTCLRGRLKCWPSGLSQTWVAPLVAHIVKIAKANYVGPGTL